MIANLSAANGQLLRGHNCVWYNQLPSWVTSGGFDNATLLSIVETHCSTVVSHYAGKTCERMWFTWEAKHSLFLAPRCVGRDQRTLQRRRNIPHRRLLHDDWHGLYPRCPQSCTRRRPQDEALRLSKASSFCAIFLTQVRSMITISKAVVQKQLL